MDLYIFYIPELCTTLPILSVCLPDTRQETEKTGNRESIRAIKFSALGRLLSGNPASSISKLLKFVHWNYVEQVYVILLLSGIEHVNTCSING